MLNPYQQYKQASLSTMGPGEILVKLFDETLLQLRQAGLLIEKKDFFQANEALNKAETIIDTLNSSLDMKYPISQQLRPLYNFLSELAVKANIQKDPAIIEDMVSLIRDLRSSFEQADKLSRQGQRAAIGGKAV